VAEQRRCVHCDALFDVNWRSGESHLWCGKAGCQRERKRRAQRARRAKGEVREAPGMAARQKHAAFMKAYRRDRPAYRERERVARKRLRAAAKHRWSAVSEAGSIGTAATVYVDEDPEAGTRLRVVTANGRVVTICVPGPESARGAASGVGLPETPVGPGFRAVIEAG